MGWEPGRVGGGEVGHRGVGVRWEAGRRLEALLVVGVRLETTRRVPRRVGGREVDGVGVGGGAQLVRVGRGLVSAVAGSTPIAPVVGVSSETAGNASTSSTDGAGKPTSTEGSMAATHATSVPAIAWSTPIPRHPMLILLLLVVLVLLVFLILMRLVRPSL
ncbi:hypothetical protein EV715DRAFT_244729, partial [Schizophyllum commune]